MAQTSVFKIKVDGKEELVDLNKLLATSAKNLDEL